MGIQACVYMCVCYICAVCYTLGEGLMMMMMMMMMMCVCVCVYNVSISSRGMNRIPRG